MSGFNVGLNGRQVVFDGSALNAYKSDNVINLGQFPLIDPEIDDTARIQRALDSLDASGGTLYIPQGIFTTSSYLSIPSNVTLKGRGASSVIRIQTNVIAGLQGKDWVTVQPRENIIIQKLKIKYDTPLTILQGDEQSGATKGHAIRFRNSTNVIIDKVYIENSPISSVDFSGCNDIQVKNSYGITSGQGFVTATNTRGISIIGNIIRPKSSEVGYEYTSIYGIQRTGVDVGEFSYDAVISGNVIYDCYYGIYIRDDSDRISITGNTIKNCTDGISVLTETLGVYSVKQLIISGNLVEDASRTGIDLRKIMRGVVSNNIVRNAGNNGIWILSYNEDLTISGNNVSYCGYHGINNANVNNIRTLISGNTCYHNGVSGVGYSGIYNRGDTRILGNVCHDDSSGQTQDYGITTEQLTPTIDGNVCYQNKVTQINVIAGGARGINQEGTLTKPIYNIDMNGKDLLNVHRIQIGTIGRSVYYMDAAPTTGTYIRGDIVFNINPTTGGFIGWSCVTGGTPGTWKTFGVISA